MAKDKFSLENGRQVMDKDPDDYWYFGVNIIDALTSEGVPIADIATDAQALALGLAVISATAVGVTTSGPVYVVGSFVFIMVKGGDKTAGVEGNYVRFRIPLTTGERTDRTLYFDIKEN